jgi:hypothetical protein
MSSSFITTTTITTIIFNHLNLQTSLHPQSHAVAPPASQRQLPSNLPPTTTSRQQHHARLAQAVSNASAHAPAPSSPSSHLYSKIQCPLPLHFGSAHFPIDFNNNKPNDR